jgi:hypothetical protein
MLELLQRIERRLLTQHSPLLADAYEALRNADAAGIHSCHDHCQRRTCVQRRRIVELETAIRETLARNAHLSDGDDCTLKELKRVIAP